MNNQNSINNEILTDNEDKYVLKSFICHRISERTFKIRNHYFPVCSRCTGIYIGAFSYFAFVYFVYIHYNLLIGLAAILWFYQHFLMG